MDPAFTPDPIADIRKELAIVDENVDKRFQQLESLIDNIEQRIANLVVGFGELTVVMEGVVSQLAYGTDEEKETFRKNVSEGRKEMLTLLQGFSDAVERENTEPEPPVE